MTENEGEQKECRPTCNVIVVHAGLGWLAAAISIRKAGHDVVVFERMPELRKVCIWSCVSCKSQLLILSAPDRCWHTGAAKCFEDPEEAGHFGGYHLTGRATS